MRADCDYVFLFVLFLFFLNPVIVSPLYSVIYLISSTAISTLASLPKSVAGYMSLYPTVAKMTIALPPRTQSGYCEIFPVVYIPIYNASIM